MWPGWGSNSRFLDYRLEICSATYCATGPGERVRFAKYHSKNKTKKSKVVVCFPICKFNVQYRFKDYNSFSVVDKKLVNGNYE